MSVTVFTDIASTKIKRVQRNTQECFVGAITGIFVCVTGLKGLTFLNASLIKISTIKVSVKVKSWFINQKENLLMLNLLERSSNQTLREKCPNPKFFFVLQSEWNAFRIILQKLWKVLLLYFTPKFPFLYLLETIDFLMFSVGK